MNSYGWLALWLYLAFVSLVMHEFGHVIAGMHYGWKVLGFKLRYAMIGGGVQIGTTERDPGKARVGMVSIAGPIMSLTVTVIFIGLAQLPIEHAWIFGSLAAFTFALFVVNLLPLPITDGGHILWAITGWRPKWRYVGAAWLLSELASTAAILLGWWQF